uniref:Uncharacterized protein n=1 Tax=Arundo donax TaxID=35708 RepID=A0A0A9FFG6_ARUDO
MHHKETSGRSSDKSSSCNSGSVWTYHWRARRIFY